jgi:DHA1 family bicyclomycin/chloramphenicol resistance-like MFS transporter
LKEEFPYIFAGLAIAIGAAVFLNGVLVIKVRNGKIDYHRPGFIFCGLGDLYALFYNTNPDVRVYCCFALQFFSIGFLSEIYVPLCNL